MPLLPPSRKILPLRMPMLLASMIPVLFTTRLARSPAARALSTTVPPLLAAITPLLVTTASALALSMLSLIRPSPARSTVTLSPAAMRTVPMLALMTPVLLTCGAISAT